MKSAMITIIHETLSPLNLSHIDFLDDPAAIHGCRLIISRAKQDASPNELTNPEILKKNHHQNTHSFGLVLPAIFPDTDISSCVCIVLLFETSSSSHVQYHIARQRGPLGPETSMWPCITSSGHEICHICIMHDTLCPLNLSHMDFLDGPAAIQGSRLIISDATQDVSSNEHMHPEIWTNNHHKFIYSFTGICLLSSLADIYLLVPV